jgi:hypothetical protein
MGEIMCAALLDLSITGFTLLAVVADECVPSHLK